MEKNANWVNTNIPSHENVIAVGTGGNISKLFNMIEGKKDNKALLKDLEKMRNFIDLIEAVEKAKNVSFRNDSGQYEMLINQLKNEEHIPEVIALPYASDNTLP